MAKADAVGTVEAQVRRMADFAYAAGILDVKGVFCAYPRKDVVGGYILRVRVRAKFGETPTMERLTAILGGHVRKDQHVEWQASGVDEVEHVLEAVRPFLSRQARRAQLLHEFCAEMRCGSRSFDERRLTDEQIDARRKLAGALDHSRHANF